MQANRLVVSLLLVLLITGCETYKVMVTSDPAGAQVRLNNRDYGPTPVTIELPTEAAPGERLDVVLRKEGFQDWRGDFRAQYEQEITARLMPLPPPPPPSPASPPPRDPASTTLSISVEPAGAVVTVDGTERGIGSTANPVTVSFRQRPTFCEVKVALPGYKTFTQTVAMEKERDNRIFVKLDPVSPWYEYTTDAELLRQAVSEVMTAANRLPTLRYGARIAVMSMTVQDNSDNPLHNLVKDAVTEALAKAGYTPAERDDRLLIHLAHSGVGESMPYRILTHHDGEEQPFDYDAEILAVRQEKTTTTAPVTTRTTTCPPPNASPCDPGAQQVRVRQDVAFHDVDQTRYVLTGYVPTADQFLAYRILDCGLYKAPATDGKPRVEPMLARRAEVRLHVRVIDAKRGVVTWAGILAGDKSDEVPIRVAEQLKNPPLKFSVEPLPTDEVSRRVNP